MAQHAPNTDNSAPSAKAASLSLAAVAALGVVYGDIGTSPLYAFKEAFGGAHALPLNPETVLAALSMLLWCLLLVVSLKYVSLVLRCDNDGEGGVLALTALAQRSCRARPKLSRWVMIIGVFAAALFYGDAVIAPAISVLSAVEGITVIAPALERFVEPIAIGILIGIFAVQRRGSAQLGRWFGPLMILWFGTLAVIGALNIFQWPMVLAAVNPVYALQFAAAHPLAAFLLLSAVFLAMTGAEALYADMGHFGAKPIRLAWFGLVWPALLLNYFGQGALLLSNPATASNPFFYMVPPAMLPVLVGLATMATVIAGQAVITGAYSLTLQASRLGYLPRMRVLHTSETERGQIYAPLVNWLLLAAVLALVLVFQNASALAAAYGVAVSGAMIITSVLTLVVASAKRGWFKRVVFVVLPVLFLLELLFFSANATKLFEGGWLPLALGVLLFTVLMTWKRGAQAANTARQEIDEPQDSWQELGLMNAARVPGTAVYMTSDPAWLPGALLHTLKHFHVLHRQIVLLHVQIADVPRVPLAQAASWRCQPGELYCVTLRFGFRDETDVPAALAASVLPSGLALEPLATTYFTARTSVVEGRGMLPAWRLRLFSWINRQSDSVANYYQLPPNQVVELGTQLAL